MLLWYNVHVFKGGITMFSEDVMLGQKKCSIDNKGRLFLPKFTYATSGDEIGIVNNDEVLLKLYSLKSLKERILKLQTGSYDSKNADVLKNIQSELEYIYASIIETSIVDSQRRLHISQDTIVTHLIKDSLYLQGASDHVNIFSNNEEFNSYKLKLSQK